MNNQNSDTIFEWQVHHLGDHAIVFSLPAMMDETIVTKIQALNNFIQTKKINAFIDYIPAYHTLTIVYDILLIRSFLKQHYPSINIDQLGLQLLQDFQSSEKIETILLTPTSIIRVPVCYDLAFGIDLLSMAEEKKLSIENIIEQHTKQTYLVYCLGFLPGFAYMGKVDKSIQVPRHEKPRSKVVAGSVGIAGAQTGIYPKDAPGGWKIIGRSPIRLFDPIHLATFKVGDHIQFYPISITEFETLNQHT